MKCILSVSTRFLAASSLSLSGVPLPTSCLVFSLEISWVQSVLPTCMCSRTLHWNVGGLPVATSGKEWSQPLPAAPPLWSGVLWASSSSMLGLWLAQSCAVATAAISRCVDQWCHAQQTFQRVPAQSQVLRVFTFSSSTVFPVGPWGRIAQEG